MARGFSCGPYLPFQMQDHMNEQFDTRIAATREMPSLDAYDALVTDLLRALNNQLAEIQAKVEGLYPRYMGFNSDALDGADIALTAVLDLLSAREVK